MKLERAPAADLTAGEAGGRRPRAVAAGCLIAALWACATLACAAGSARPASRLPPGFAVHMCFQWPTRPQPRLSFWWLSPNAAGAPRWAYNAAAYPDCTLVPWLPGLPQYGARQWP